MVYRSLHELTTVLVKTGAHICGLTRDHGLENAERQEALSWQYLNDQMKIQSYWLEAKTDMLIRNPVVLKHSWKTIVF